jgi:hypothetical protein
MSTTPPSITWPATADNVAALLRARTQDEAGTEGGAWSDETRPTLAEVELILSMAESIVLGQTGTLDALACETADEVRSQAGTLVSLMAAMLIELSYFPEQVQTNRSAYEQYATLFDTLMPQLVQAVEECAGGSVEPGGGTDGGGTVPNPSFAFPQDVGGMVGWQTRW